MLASARQSAALHLCRAALRSYAEETGGMPIPESYQRSGERVGQWALRMRQSYRSGKLEDAEQIRLLGAVPGWDWNRLTDFQERMLSLVSEYVASHAGELPPKGYLGPDGEKVGTWITTQINALNKGTINPWLSERLSVIPGWLYRPTVCIETR